MTPTKLYDERYFRRWYRGRHAVASAADLKRRATLAVAVAEHVLERPVRSVLVVGCGEARWRAPLKTLRPRATYTGVDPSEWVVQRWGRARRIQKGSVGELATLDLDAPYDLIVCDDVLHYVEETEMAQGLAAMRRMTASIVWIQLFTKEDAFEGDKQGWHARSAAAYRRARAKAGLIPVAPGCWLPKERRGALTALERP
jgi:SAM-dependent methyltransferase